MFYLLFAHDGQLGGLELTTTPNNTCTLTVLSKVSLGHTCSGVGLLGPGVYIYVISQNSSRLFVPVYCSHWASLVAQLVKNPPAIGRPGFDPWVGKIPWRRERLPTPIFWPGEFHGLYSPWGRKESDTIECLSLSCRISSITSL